MGGNDEQGELLLFCRANVAIWSDLTGLLQTKRFEALWATRSLLPSTLASISSVDRVRGTPLPAPQCHNMATVQALRWDLPWLGNGEEESIAGRARGLYISPLSTHPTDRQ